jgi:hypothetical protein
MPANTSNNPGIVYDNIQSSGVKVVNPANSYTALSDDNFIICGANSIAITLDGNSNSPIHISSIDGVTARTGCTISIVVPAGTQDWVIADSGCAATCTRVGDGPLWHVVGAKTAS